MTDSANTESLFPAILASTVHDIKNSLGIVLELIGRMAEAEQPGPGRNVSQLEFEANRINHSLMQLLVIYKIDASKFALHIDEYPALDIINETSAHQYSLSRYQAIDLQIDCDDNLMCYCDYPNISNALATILNNALRYTHSKIALSACKVDGYIKFCIEDDGDGFPEHLLSADLDSSTELDWVQGNTGLGLFFVSTIAGLHRNNGKSGFVKIDNNSRLVGARFCLFLP